MNPGEDRQDSVMGGGNGAGKSHFRGKWGGAERLSGGGGGGLERRVVERERAGGKVGSEGGGRTKISRKRPLGHISGEGKKKAECVDVIIKRRADLKKIPTCKRKQEYLK